MIDPKELLFTVDDENNPIQPEARDLVHSKGIWHRTSHIWIVNDDGAVLCQQRSLSKDSNPGLWEPFFGGHLPPNTSYEQGAVDELKEELGISINKSDLALFSIYKADDGKMYVDTLTTVELPRVAGRIGYGLARISEKRGKNVREVLAPINA